MILDFSPISLLLVELFIGCVEQVIKLMSEYFSLAQYINLAVVGFDTRILISVDNRNQPRSKIIDCLEPQHFIKSRDTVSSFLSSSSVLQHLYILSPENLNSYVRIQFYRTYYKILPSELLPLILIINHTLPLSYLISRRGNFISNSLSTFQSVH